MTPRYRCPWGRCKIEGRLYGTAAKVRFHILERHRAVLMRGLAFIETFGTRKPLDPPRNALKGHPGTNHTHASGMPCRCGAEGVSGEGDS